MDFGRGFIAGFVNQDLSHAGECSGALTTLRYNFNNITIDLEHLMNTKNETDKRNVTKDILHIIERMPEDFAGCQELSNVCEKLA